MAKSWRAMHRKAKRNRERPVHYCEYVYRRKPLYDGDEGYHPHKRKCGNIGEPCWLSPWDDPESWYCSEHKGIEGFCYGCGVFGSGIESFDFGRLAGWCDNCQGQIENEEYRERYYADDYDDYDPEWTESGYC